MRHLHLLALLLPFFASASGFPDSSLWLSKTNPVEGETIHVYAAVHNSDPSALEGEVLFFAGEEKIGNASFSLESDASGIVSIPWGVRAGEYAVSARIEGAGSLERAQSGTVSLTVAEANKEPLAESVETANTLFSSFASSTLPYLGSIGETAFAKTEGWRKSGVEALEAYVEKKEKEPTAAADSPETGTSTPEEKESVWSKAAQIAAVGALFTLQNPALFYPLALLALLFFLYIFAKRLAGRSYRD